MIIWIQLFLLNRSYWHNGCYVVAGMLLRATVKVFQRYLIPSCFIEALWADPLAQV